MKFAEGHASVLKNHGIKKVSTMGASWAEDHQVVKKSMVELVFISSPMPIHSRVSKHFDCTTIEQMKFSKNFQNTGLQSFVHCGPQWKSQVWV
jgi:hypothetical protein